MPNHSQPATLRRQKRKNLLIHSILSVQCGIVLGSLLAANVEWTVSSICVLALTMMVKR